MCGQITANGQIADMTKDLRMTWILIQEAALQERSDELTDIAVNLFGQLGEAQAEISRLRTTVHTLAGQHQPSLTPLTPLTSAAQPPAVLSPAGKGLKIPALRS